MLRKEPAVLHLTGNRKTAHGRKFEPTQSDPRDAKLKLKGPDVENRSQSASGHLRGDESGSKAGTARTRSASPGLGSPLVSIEVPLRKYYNIYSKIVVQLETVKSLSENKSNECENLLDLRRQLQRADEFAIRFSRNNLYETKRILNEIKKLIAAYSLDGLSESETRLLSKKIIVGYQAASQSLQIYINYIRNPSNLEVPEKITELVLLIGELFLCSEHLSLPPNEVYLQHDAVKICNDLISILNAKPPVGECLELKREPSSRRKAKTATEGQGRMKKLSMYRAKPATRARHDAPGKKFRLPSLLAELKAAEGRSKRGDARARLTHEIYTQKLNGSAARVRPPRGVRFEPAKPEREDEAKAEGRTEKKVGKKKTRFTPREVKSQDDDVETMVQAIEDDEPTTSAALPALGETGEDREGATFNRSDFRELLLEALEDLETAGKSEDGAALRRILSSLQRCSGGRGPRAPAVGLVHVRHRDSDDEVGEKIAEELEPGPESSSESIQEEFDCEDGDGAERKVGRLNPMFRLPGRGAGRGAGGRIELRLDAESVRGIEAYRKSFADYADRSVMYRKSNATRPWELVGRISDRIIHDVIREIAEEFESDAILKRLYFNELSEVAS